MKILPYRRFTIETPLSPSEVETRLRGAVVAPAIRFTRPERPFTGHVDGNTFDVARSVSGRNSFRPRVRGRVEAAGRGARLEGTMAIDTLVLVFMGALLPTLGIAFGSLALEELRRGQVDPAAFIAVGVVIVVAVAAPAVFIPEARRALDELVRIVDASRGELR